MRYLSTGSSERQRHPALRMGEKTGLVPRTSLSPRETQRRAMLPQTRASSNLALLIIEHALLNDRPQLGSVLAAGNGEEWAKRRGRV